MKNTLFYNLGITILYIRLYLISVTQVQTYKTFSLHIILEYI